MSGRGSFLDRHLYILVHLKGLLTGGFFRSAYSQWGEDLVVLKLLPEKRGTYVDVGAFHPFHYSNTALLYKRGWSGLNIDPNPEAIRLFNFHRKRDTNVLAGVAPKESILPYYVFNHQACNTFSKEQRDLMLARPFIHLIEEKQVPVKPLQLFVNEHLKNRPIDFLNVDVEGMSMEVLQSIDFSRTLPRVICIEDDEYNDAAPEKGSAVHTFLMGHTYTLAARCGRSSIYSRV